MRDIGFLRTLIRMYSFRPEIENIARTRRKLEDIAQLQLAAQERQYLLASLTDFAVHLKTHLSDYHKWYSRNIEDLAPTLELFAYSKYLWDFVTLGLPIPYIPELEEAEPGKELEKEPEKVEGADSDPELSAEPDKEIHSQTPEASNLEPQQPTKQKSLLSKSFLKLRKQTSQEKLQKQEKKLQKQLQKQQKRQSQDPVYQRQQELEQQLREQEQLEREQKEKEQAERERKEREAREKKEREKRERQEREDQLTEQQKQERQEQMKNLEANLSYFVTQSVNAHYERLAFQKRPFRVIGFGNFVEDLERELRAELKVFVPYFARFHANAVHAAVEAYARAYGINIDFLLL